MVFFLMLMVLIRNRLPESHCRNTPLSFVLITHPSRHTCHDTGLQPQKTQKCSCLTCGISAV